MPGTIVELDERAATIRLDFPGRALRERPRALPAAGAREGTARVAAHVQELAYEIERASAHAG